MGYKDLLNSKEFRIFKDDFSFYTHNDDYPFNGGDKMPICPICQEDVYQEYINSKMNVND